MSLPRRALRGCFFAALLLPAATFAHGAPPQRQTVWLLLKDGRQMEASATLGTIRVEGNGGAREMAAGDLLSIDFGGAASPAEMARISMGLAAIGANTDRAARDAAVSDLSDIGLPVLSPLLAAYKDTDRHEPQPLMRLYDKIMPGYSDSMDRTLDRVRLANGDTLRGRVSAADLTTEQSGRKEVVALADLRRLAVRRRVIDRTFTIDALRHTTPLEFLDTGVAVSASSSMEESAQGLVRLSFDIDGWASDPDGLKKPGPNYKSNLVDGFPFGALVGRVGPAGARWLAGTHIRKSAFQPGRLYFAVNDNGHWQNNVGSFRVRLHATDAYDVGDAQ